MRLDWSTLTRGEVALAFERGAICALGVGSLEQHGEHLPTDTDTFLASAVTDAAAERSAATVVTLPPLPYGFSPHHVQFGGTISMSGATFSALMRDLCRSVRTAGARSFVVINGHGGNQGLLRAVGQEETSGGFTVATLSYWDAAPEDARRLFAIDGGNIGHAGQAETSLSLALRGELVGIAGASFEAVTTPPRLPTYSLLGASGVIGDPGAASAELGRHFLEAVTDRCASLFEQLAFKSLANP